MIGPSATVQTVRLNSARHSLRTRVGIKNGCPRCEVAHQLVFYLFTPDIEDASMLFFVEDCTDLPEIPRRRLRRLSQTLAIPALTYLRANRHPYRRRLEFRSKGHKEANYSSGVLTTGGGLVLCEDRWRVCRGRRQDRKDCLWTVHGTRLWRGCPMNSMVNDVKYNNNFKPVAPAV